MTKAQALAKWAEVYKQSLCASGFGGTCIETAVQFGVMDMINQTKNMTEQAAAFMINDDADWMAGKLAA